MWWGTILLGDYHGLEILPQRHYKLLKHVQIHSFVTVDSAKRKGQAILFNLTFM
jgi:hypothetical protein